VSVVPLRLRAAHAREHLPGHVPRTKRLLDVTLSTLALLLLSPVLAAIAVAVRLTSPGPALFRQERVGLHARPFLCLKFRTMRVDAADAPHRQYVTRLLTEAAPPTGSARGLFKLEDDPRVTPIGRLLRRTSLDELPQLVNVLRGEMSLVGPRPALAWEAELYLPEEHRRFEVLPGITGLWQVSGRSRLSMREALALDVEYVRRRSLALDLWILARTVPAVLRSEGG
jgi:lipopolysaccharide/colanic/teichoic acid biosynthesis glycosyltransferase